MKSEYFIFKDKNLPASPYSYIVRYEDSKNIEYVASMKNYSSKEECQIAAELQLNSNYLGERI